MTPALLLAMGGPLCHRPRAGRVGRVAACKRTPQAALLTPAGLGPSGRPFAPCPPAVGRAQQRPGRQVARSAALAVPAGVESALALLETPLVRDVAAAALAVVGSKMLVRFFAVLEMHEVINRVGARAGRQGERSACRPPPGGGLSLPVAQAALHWRCLRGHERRNLHPASALPCTRLTSACVVQNTSRKLVHTLAGPLFILTWPLFRFVPRPPRPLGSHAVARPLRFARRTASLPSAGRLPWLSICTKLLPAAARTCRAARRPTPAPLPR